MPRQVIGTVQSQTVTTTDECNNDYNKKRNNIMTTTTNDRDACNYINKYTMLRTTITIIIRIIMTTRENMQLQ